MNTDLITDAGARAAFEAWQGLDLQAWLSHFTPEATLFDDGNRRDFQAFSKEIGRERFTSIERVEEQGTKIVGQFHSDTWGDFKTFFHFHAGPAGQFVRLDIGQA